MVSNHYSVGVEDISQLSRWRASPPLRCSQQDLQLLLPTSHRHRNGLCFIKTRVRRRPRCRHPTAATVTRASAACHGRCLSVMDADRVGGEDGPGRHRQPSGGRSQRCRATSFVWGQQKSSNSRQSFNVSWFSNVHGWTRDKSH